MRKLWGLLFFLSGFCLHISAQEYGATGATGEAGATGATGGTGAAEENFCIPYDWNGFYVGAHAGYGWSCPTVDFSPLPSVTVAGVLPAGANPHLGGAFGGLQFGYNYQCCCLVWGFEVDATYADIEGSAKEGPLFTSGGGFFPESLFRVKERMEIFGTVRPRLGWALGRRFFIYGTGGLAWARTLYEARSEGFLVDETLPVSFRKTKLGWTIGAGIEHALWKRCSLKAEYLYMSFGEAKGVGRAISSAVEANYRFETYAHTLQVGLNYNFGCCAR